MQFRHIWTHSQREARRHKLIFWLLKVGHVVLLLLLNVEVVEGGPLVGLLGHVSHLSSSNASCLSACSSKTSHLPHHLLKVLSLAGLLLLILIDPVLVVDLEPVLLQLAVKQPVPVGTLLYLLQHKGHLTGSNSKLGLVGVDLLEELHGDLVLLHLCPSHTLEVKLLLLHIDHWVLAICEADGENDVLWPLGPNASRRWRHLPAVCD